MSKLLEKLGIEPYAARSATEPHIALRKGGTVAINGVAQAELGLQEGRRYRLGVGAKNGNISVAILRNGPEKGRFKLSGQGFNAAGMFKARRIKLDGEPRPGVVATDLNETADAAAEALAEKTEEVENAADIDAARLSELERELEAAHEERFKAEEERDEIIILRF